MQLLGFIFSNWSHNYTRINISSPDSPIVHARYGTASSLIPMNRMPSTSPARRGELSRSRFNGNTSQ
jgi:hypothetical protein